VVLSIVVVVLASGSGGGVLAYNNVKDQASQLQAELTAHLQAGQSELEAAKTSLKEANSKHDQTMIAQANVHFTTARVQFMVARQMADASPLLQRLETMPEVGAMARSRHVAVDAIADVGVAIADAGRELADLDGQLVKPAVKGQEAKTLLTVLNQTKTSLVKVRADFVRAKAAAALVDLKVLPGAQRAGFVKAKATLDTALAAMDDFDRLVPVITELVGGNGPRTYLVEQVNQAELRPGGGFIGTFSVIQANQGTVKLIRSGRGPDLSYPRASPGQTGYVTPPGPFREWLPNTGWSFQDSNFYPDFARNAQEAARFAEPRLGIHLDGVISIAGARRVAQRSRRHTPPAGLFHQRHRPEGDRTVWLVRRGESDRQQGLHAGAGEQPRRQQVEPLHHPDLHGRADPQRFFPAPQGDRGSHERHALLAAAE
jgi:hypothetical protein